MKISLSMCRQRLKVLTFGFIVAFALLLPYSTFSQNGQSERQTPVVGSGPWENSRRVSAGARPDYPSSGSAATSSSQSGRAARPAGGAAVDLVDPGGPPDVEVPLDENLTLIFLAGAIVFAFWVAKKRMTAKPVAVKNDK